MNMTRHLLLGMASIAIGSVTTYTATAQDNLETFRTTAYFDGLTQGTNANGDLVYKDASLAGHNLVNLAMGRSVNDTNFPLQVLALTVDCDLSSASLVVYDESISNIVGGIASSSVIDIVKQQDSKKLAGPNRAQFVATLNLFQTGNAANGLLGGYITIAGRINLNPTNSCPQPVVVLGPDPFDNVDVELPPNLDLDRALESHTGLAHATGDIMIVTGGNTETVLLPEGDLSIRRELPTVEDVQTD
jgi:hypothetical protein